MHGDSGRITWHLRELLQQAGVTPVTLGRAFVGTPGDALVNALTVDSRQVSPGCCFVALAGSRVDGHGFVDQALQAGATLAVVEAGREPSNTNRFLSVNDTHATVARLAAAFYGLDRIQQAGRLVTIGVTGTNGKTTVCALLRAVLETAGQRPALLGTIANDVLGEALPAAMTTLPPIELCALLRRAVDRGATHAVMEASSHALDQRRCAGLDFRVGVFTNLTQDHLDYHADLEAYAQAKKRLFDGLSPGATAAVNAEDARGEYMVADTQARVLRFALEPGAAPGSARGVDISARIRRLDMTGTDLTLRIEGRETDLRTSLIGRHNVRNILAAASAAVGLGLSPAIIRQGLESVQVVPGRLERVRMNAPTSFEVFVDYAHTPDALLNVLSILRELKRGRLICLFGCGGDRDRGKRPLMGRVVAEAADLVILTSDNPRSEDPQAIIADALTGMNPAGQTIVEPDRRAAITRAIALAQPGDVVLLAGKGHEDYQVVGDRKLPFSDALVARETLTALAENRPMAQAANA